MILMLDHITIATSAECRQSMLEQFPGYSVRFSEEGVPNIPAKRQLFQCPHEDHQLIKLDHPTRYPMELVVYDTCCGHSGITVDSETHEIRIQTQNIERSALFWRTLGFRHPTEDISFLIAKGILEQSEIKIRLIRNPDENEAFLDQYGPVALAFIVTSQPTILAKIAQNGFWVSGIDGLQVNGKELHIAFSSSGYGDIAELISIPAQKSTA